jgi:hypothetical protein
MHTSSLFMFARLSEYWWVVAERQLNDNFLSAGRRNLLLRRCLYSVGLVLLLIVFNVFGKHPLPRGVDMKNPWPITRQISVSAAVTPVQGCVGRIAVRTSNEHLAGEYPGRELPEMICIMRQKPTHAVSMSYCGSNYLFDWKNQ